MSAAACAQGEARLPPFISVVVPVLNGRHEVEACVAALRAQTYPPERFEILFVDNGSTDGTREHLESLGVRVVPCPQRGRARALNAGLAVAGGELICTTDPGCVPEPGWLQAVAASFADPTVGCVAGEILMLEGGSSLALEFQRRCNYMSPLRALGRRHAPYFPFADGANASFRRAVFEAIGPFEASFIKGADVEICYRMLVLTDYKLAFNAGARVWEAGEPDLRALLHQRFRMGIGVNLLRMRFPEFFQKPARRAGVRRWYWAARGRLSELGRILALALRGTREAHCRAQAADALILQAMNAAKLLGLIYGRYLLARRRLRPEPLPGERLRAFLAGDPLAGRVVVENPAGS